MTYHEPTLAERQLQLLEGEFQKLLATKTGWGRNEVMTAFREAMKNAQIAALMEKVEK